jgi:hypothetical protein
MGLGYSGHHHHSDHHRLGMGVGRRLLGEQQGRLGMGPAPSGACCTACPADAGGACSPWSVDACRASPCRACPDGTRRAGYPGAEQYDAVRRRERFSAIDNDRCRFITASERAEAHSGAVFMARENEPALAHSSRLMKRALPRPVPIVNMAHDSTSRMNGASLRPCTTASLCIRTVVS